MGPATDDTLSYPSSVKREAHRGKPCLQTGCANAYKWDSWAIWLY